MNPTVIDVLGEYYFLISLSGTDEEPDNLNLTGKHKVYLFPSLTADFGVRSYSKAGALCSYDPAAEVSAAAYLSLKQGLPLDEFIFETPVGFLKISRTGRDIFEIVIPKCKVLFTDIAEIHGCPIQYSDILVGDVLRVVRAENIDWADPLALSALLSVGRYLPTALLFSSVNDGMIEMSSYTDFNPSPPSRVLLYAAAALANQGQDRILTSRDARLSVKAAYSAVSLKIKCEI